MIIGVYIITALLFLILLFITLMVKRINWVLNARIKVLNELGYMVYRHLPPFNTMLHRFWIWDINKFLEGAAGGRTEGHENV